MKERAVQYASTRISNPRRQRRRLKRVWGAQSGVLPAKMSTVSTLCALNPLSLLSREAKTAVPPALHEPQKIGKEGVVTYSKDKFWSQQSIHEAEDQVVSPKIIMCNSIFAFLMHFSLRLGRTYFALLLGQTHFSLRLGMHGCDLIFVVNMSRSGGFIVIRLTIVEWICEIVVIYEHGNCWSNRMTVLN